MSSKSKMQNELQQKAVQNQALKQKRQIIFILKLIMLICVFLIVTLIVLWLVDLSDNEINFFNHHFLLPTCLFLVGVIALCLPNSINKSKFSDNKGDKMMPVIGIMLIVCALLSIFLSFSGMF